MFPHRCQTRRPFLKRPSTRSVPRWEGTCFSANAILECFDPFRWATPALRSYNFPLPPSPLLYDKTFTFGFLSPCCSTACARIDWAQLSKVSGSAHQETLTAFNSTLSVVAHHPTGIIELSHLRGAPKLPPRTSDYCRQPATHTMCTKVVHKYACGHELVETAPCANKKAGDCKRENVKNVPHTEKCERICGG